MNAPQENKSLFGNSFRIFLIRFFNTMAGMIVMIWLSHHLPATLYGVYQNFWVQLTLLSSIAGLGLGLLIFTYPPEVLRQLLRQLRLKHYMLYAAILVIAGLSFTFLQQREGITAASLLYFLFFIFYAVTILLEALVIVIRRHKLLLVTGAIYAILFVGAGWVTWSMGFRLERFLLCLLPFTVLRCLTLLLPLRHFMREASDTGKEQPFRSKEVLSLWRHLGFYDLFSVTIQWIDKFAVSLLATSSVAAVYFNGSYNIPFIPIALSAVGNATLMQLNYARTADDKAKLMRQAGRMLSCVAYPVFFLLLIYSREFITIVFSDKYETSVPIFICSLLILPVRAYSNTTILQNLHRGRIINIGVLIDFLVALALAGPLYYFMGLPGIALSFVISTYIQVSFYLYYSARLLKVPVSSLIPIKNWLFKGLFFGLLLLGLHWGLAILKPIYSFMIAAAITGSAALLLLKYEARKDL